jgi:hypothetical protein
MDGYFGYGFLFHNGRIRKDIAPNTTTIRVCEIHMIHPNASPEIEEIPKIASELLTTMGYRPTPPLVVDMAKAPATNGTSNSPTERPTVSGTVYLMTQNMAKYASQIKKE